MNRIWQRCEECRVPFRNFPQFHRWASCNGYIRKTPAHVPVEYDTHTPQMSRNRIERIASEKRGGL